MDFVGSAANIITNNGILDGTLTAGNGNNTLLLGADSESLGMITFGDGNNNVTINNGAEVNSIITGSGNDTFTLNELSGSNTYLGTINAGAGTNSLAINRSKNTLQADTSLQGFTNIDLNENTDLTLISQNNIMAGTVSLDSSSKLLFGEDYDGNFSANLGKSLNSDGSIIVSDGANVELTNTGQNTFSGGWAINSDGTLTVTRDNQIASSSGFALSGVLNLKGLTTLNNALTGAGTLNINNASTTQAFNFGSLVGNAFTGNVSLNNTGFTLSGANTTALQNATLTNNSGSVVTVGTSDQTIKEMVFAGGTTDFSTGNINTTLLSVTKQSDIHIVSDDIIAGGLLDQNEKNTRKIIASTNTLTADEIALLSLQNTQGGVLGNQTLVDINQGQVKVADGTYNYGLSGEGSGLSVTAQLIKLALIEGESLLLDTTGSTSKILNALITGAGDLTVEASDGGLTLNNKDNAYTGSTTINGGTVVAGSDNALGNTSLLRTLANASFNLNGKVQTLGALVNAGSVEVGENGSLTVAKNSATGTTGEFNNTGIVNINEGSLVLNNGGTSTTAGGLTGDGSLVVSGGEFRLSQANMGLSGTTTIDKDGTIILNSDGSLGNAKIAVNGKLNLNTDLTLANVLSGSGNVNTGGEVILSGENTFQGKYLINANSSLSISQAANLGNTQAGVVLQGATSSLVLNSLNDEVGQSLTGVLGSQINIVNKSNTLLTGQNSGFEGTYAVGGDSILATRSSSALGAEAKVSLEEANDALNLLTYRGDFANQVDGKGIITLTKDALVTMNSMANIGANIGINIDNSSALNLSGITSFDQALSGAGSLNVNTQNQAFAFGVNTQSAFSGNVTLTDTLFELTQNNANALANATLTLNQDSVTDVGDTDRTLKNINVNGGKLIFTANAPQSKANGIINTESLVLNDGEVSLTGGATWDNIGTPAAPGLSILEQDRGTVLMKLVNATKVTGNVNDLNLNINGSSVISEVKSTITQGGTTVADATYDYGLTSDQSGLSINYGLQALALITQNADALLLETGGAGSNATLNAVLSGQGGLNINALNNALTIANENNSYTGETTVSQGSLRLGANKALGNTSQLNILQGANVSLNGFTQTVGMLGNSGTVLLDNGELVLSNGGQSTSKDGLAGKGKLTIAGGNLSISDTNNNLSGNTVITDQASVTLRDNGNFGSSDVSIEGSLNLDVVGLTLDNTLSGNGRVNINAATSLTGNSIFTGEHHVSQDGALTLTQANNLGADQAGVYLNASGASLTMNGLSGAIKNALSGVLGSTVILTNAANVQLTGNNDSFIGRYELDGNSTLTVDSLSQLGKGASVLLTSTLDKLILLGYQGEFSNRITGDGILTLTDQANIILGAGYQVAQTIALNINSNSTLTLSDLNNVDHALTGNGRLNVISGSPTFIFGRAVGTTFTGEVNLLNTGLELGNSNTTALTNANLMLSEGSLVNVADGVQAIGGLIMNKGILKFDNIIDNSGEFISEGTIKVGSIDVTRGGTVQVNLPNSVTPGLEGKTLLALDEGAVVVDLVQGNAIGTAQELTLADANNQPITQLVQAALTNDDATSPSAQGAFGYGLTTGTNQDGLSVNYGLKAIELQAKNGDALKFQALAANNGLQSNGMSATISGSGDLAVEGLTDSAILSLNNSNNDYTGATLVRKGGLQLNASNALGFTSELAMSKGTQVDINGVNQILGKLNAQADSLFNLNGGNVTITNGGQIDGVIMGAGQLSLSAGTLNLSQANSTFTGSTTIDSPASVELNNVAGLGTGTIANHGSLTLNGAQGIFSNSLSQSGNVQLQNNTTIQLSGNNGQFAGIFTLAEGTTLAANKSEQLGGSRVNNNGRLILDVARDWRFENALSGGGSLVKQGTGTLKLINNVVNMGNTIVENGLIQLGEGTVKGQNMVASRARSVTTPVSVTLNSNVAIQENGALGGLGRVTGNVDNAGRLIMPHALTGDNYADFTINGNYVGQQGSQIIFDTVLAGENSATDRLVINGDTSGTSTISVNNIGGQGSYSSNGIKIVDISGESGASFELEKRVVAGAYEYTLYQEEGADSNANGWYLRTDNPDRPEAGSYIANLAAANTMFNSSLENRSGETWYTDMITGEKKQTSMWLRTTGSHNRSRDVNSTFKTQDNRFVMQLGGDVFRFSSNENDLWRVGLMTGYANSSSTTTTFDSGRYSKGSAQGYTVGTYGTWFENEGAPTGAYIDSWLQYSWFKNEVSGEELTQEQYHSKGFTASLESGYTLLAGMSGSYNFYLQPKAQIIWMGVKAGNHTDASKTQISSKGNGNVQTHLGMKAFITESTQEKAAQAQVFKPYIEATWIHNSKDFAAKMSHETTGSHTFKQGGAGNIAEIKLGLEGDITDRLNTWGSVGQQVGSKGYSDTTVTFGVKYNF